MSNEDSRPGCTRTQVDEAAVWLALLHRPDRTLQVERGFQRWLKERPGHAAAFEQVSKVWEMAELMAPEPLPKMERRERDALGHRWRWIGSIALAASVAALAVMGYAHVSGVASGIGEQRTLVLEDGSRIVLNTDTRVRVKYSSAHRAVELKHGEAYFEVAKQHKDWPFVVKMDDRSVTALGTSFLVRHEDQRSSVTLIEGVVAVTPAQGEVGSISADVLPLTPTGAIIVAPGDRLTFIDGQPPRVDRPSLEKETAWRHGFVEFEGTRLADTIDEMSRYSTIELRLEDPRAADLPVTGTFRIGDTASFAAAVADVYHLRMIKQTGRITLSGEPRLVK